jgi:hypothetical protein
MAIAETDFDAHPSVSAALFAFDSDGNIVPLKGSVDGAYLLLLVALSGSALKLAEVEVVVTNGNTVSFEITADDDTNPIPNSLKTSLVGLYPSASTKWRLTLFSRAARANKDILYDDDRTSVDWEASSDNDLNATPISYKNADGDNRIFGSLTIPSGENDATFNIAILFE